MDKEFHYNLTFLIAIYSGFQYDWAQKIAYASQFIDDNNIIYPIVNHRSKSIECNYISQIYNCFKYPLTLMTKIYICYHFIPGDIVTDDKNSFYHHPLASTANSFLTLQIMHFAMQSMNPYLIAIATHAYVDSFAHIHFTGTLDIYNSISFLQYLNAPSIGHASYLYQPDKIGLIWYDCRHKEFINNNDRFLKASESLFKIYRHYLNYLPKAKSNLHKQYDCASFINSITDIWQCNNKKLSPSINRIQAYNELLQSDKLPLPPVYHHDTWRNMAIAPLESTIKIPYIGASLLYQYRHELNYMQSDWYQFHQALKQYQRFVWNLIIKHAKKSSIYLR